MAEDFSAGVASAGWPPGGNLTASAREKDHTELHAIRELRDVLRDLLLRQVQLAGVQHRARAVDRIEEAVALERLTVEADDLGSFLFVLVSPNAS
jgi:hypothetical protein